MNRRRQKAEQAAQLSSEEKAVQALEARVKTQLASLAQSSTNSLTVSLDDLRALERQLAKQTAELHAAQAELDGNATRVAESLKAASAMEEELHRYKQEKEKEMELLKTQLDASEKARTALEEAATAQEALTGGVLDKEAELKRALTASESNYEAAQREMEELRRLLSVQREETTALEITYRQEFQKHSDDLLAWREREKEMTAMRRELASTKEAMAKMEGELAHFKEGEVEIEKVG